MPHFEARKLQSCVRLRSFWTFEMPFLFAKLWTRSKELMRHQPLLTMCIWTAVCGYHAAASSVHHVGYQTYAEQHDIV